MSSCLASLASGGASTWWSSIKAPPSAVMLPREYSCNQPISAAENVAHPPFVLLMNLNEAREEIDRSGIAVLIGGLCGATHLLHNHEEVSIGLFDHVSNIRMWRCRWLTRFNE